MITSGAAFTLFDKAMSVLGLIREGKRQRTEKTDQALLALYTALRETQGYLAELKSGMANNPDKELSLAGLWQLASVPLREIDIELAEKCFEKGGYWLNPEAWNPARIEAKDIALDNMLEATRKLLVG
jgi:hypothetical protein